MRGPAWELAALVRVECLVGSPEIYRWSVRYWTVEIFAIAGFGSQDSVEPAHLAIGWLDHSHSVLLE